MGTSSLKVSELVSRIEHNEIRLPEMQRSFVWTETQIRDLLDSLYRGFPSGTILTWEAGKEVAQRTRAFSIDQKESSQESFQLLLDGQQRLTALSAILRGSPLKARKREQPIDILFNLEHPDRKQFATEVHENVDDENEDSEAPDGNDDDILKRAKQMAFVVKTNRLANLPEWVSVTEVFKNEDDSHFLSQSGIESIKDERYKKYAKRLTKQGDCVCFESFGVTFSPVGLFYFA